MNELLIRYLEPASLIVAVIGVLASLIAAMRAGIVKKLVVGPFTLEGSSDEVAQARALIATVSAARGEHVPFETEQLARYYAQVLAQSKISFWFSLFFASLGFLVIVVSALMYSQD